MSKVRAHAQCGGLDETFDTFAQAKFHGEAHLLFDCREHRVCFVAYSDLGEGPEYAYLGESR